MRLFLSGGLGSQLFQIAAGRHLSLVWGEELIIDLSWAKVSRHPENLSLRGNLALQAGERFSIVRPLPLGIAEIQVSQFLFKNTWVFTKRFRALKHSDSITELENMGKAIAVSGNFTDPNIHRNLKSQGLGLRFLTKNEYSSQGNKPYCAVHVRGGDYFGLGDSFGVLGPQYYKEALSLVDDNLEPILITNDVQHARFIRSNLGLDNARIFGPRDLTPLQSLELMSGSQALIAANSSFSWWGAELSDHAQTRVCPDKYSPRADKNWMVSEGWLTAGASWAD